MRYTQDQEDKALSRLMADIEAHNPKPQRTAGVPVVMALLMVLLAVFMLMSQGCGTIKGIGEDLQDASDAARVYFAEETVERPIDSE